MRDAELLVQIRREWKENYEVYGAAEGVVSAQSGRDHGGALYRRAAHARRWAGRRPARPRTTRADPNAARSADLVERQFTADRPNALWVADITYVPTWSGRLIPT